MTATRRQCQREAKVGVGGTQASNNPTGKVLVVGTSHIASYFTKCISQSCIWNLLTWGIGLVVCVAKKPTAWGLLRTLVQRFLFVGISTAGRAWILDSSWCLNLPRPLNIYEHENSEVRSQEELSILRVLCPVRPPTYTCDLNDSFLCWASSQNCLFFTSNSQIFSILPEPVRGHYSMQVAPNSQPSSIHSLPKAGWWKLPSEECSLHRPCVDHGFLIYVHSGPLKWGIPLFTDGKTETYRSYRI